MERLCKLRIINVNASEHGVKKDKISIQSVNTSSYCFSMIMFYKPKQQWSVLAHITANKLIYEMDFSFFNPLSDDNILDRSKLKAFADDKVKSDWQNDF